MVSTFGLVIFALIMLGWAFMAKPINKQIISQGVLINAFLLS